MLVHASPTTGAHDFHGLVSRPSDALLVSRAIDYLSAGPATAQALIAAVCQMPGVPPQIAEHMATTLLRHMPTIRRDAAGFWGLHPRPRAGSNAQRRLDELSYVVVDVETTGGRPHQGDRITPRSSRRS
jgi:hypothetical protein